MKTKSICLILLLGGLALYSCKNKQPASGPYTLSGSVEKISPAMDDIIRPGVRPEIIADSFFWSEGPLWVPGLNALLFSDIPQNAVFQWTETHGLNLYLKPSGYTDTIHRGGETGSNGLLLDPAGQLVLCQHGDRRMARMDAPLNEPVPVFIPLAADWDGKRFNSPNDGVYNNKGDLFFTDPAYGMEMKWTDPKREIDFAGVYKMSPDGLVSLLIDSIPAPNGIGLSPDETRLYVASSGSDASWYEYRIADDGSLYGGRVFFDASEIKKHRQGSPDGLAVRQDGIIFASGPGGVLVFDPEGNHLGNILTGQLTSNCTLDTDGAYLYMTAHMFLMRIRLK